MKNITGFISLILLIGVLCIPFNQINSFSVQAAPPQINTTLDFSLQVDKNHRAEADIELTLTNIGSVTVLTEYYLNVGDLDLRDVKLKTPNPNLSVSYVPKENNNKIKITFNKITIKKGKSYKVYLSAKVNGVMQNKGLVNIVKLPFVFSGFNSDSHINISMHQSLGQLLYTTFPYDNSAHEDHYYKYSFPATDFNHSVFVFGQEQVYRVSSVYNLENTADIPKEHFVYIPTYRLSNQPPIIESIDPLPTAATMIDNNLQLQYLLDGDEKERLALTMIFPVNPDDFTKFSLTAEESTNYLNIPFLADLEQEDYQFLEQQFAAIQQEDSDMDKVNLIVDWFKNHGQFGSGLRQQFKAQNFSRTNTVNDIENLMTTPFTDVYTLNAVFAVILRSYNIPARLVYGGIYPYHQEIEEATTMNIWVQYYDQELKRWVSADLVWGLVANVPAIDQLDMSHIPMFELDPNREVKGILGQKMRITYGIGAPSAKQEVTLSAHSSATEDHTNVEVQIRNKGNVVAFIKSMDLLKNELMLTWNSDQVNRHVLLPGQELAIDLQGPRQASLFDHTYETDVVVQVSTGANNQEISKEFKVFQAASDWGKVIYGIVAVFAFFLGLLVIVLVFKKYPRVVYSK